MPDGARVGKQDASLVHRDVAARLAARFGVGLRDCVNRPPEASSGGEIDPLEGRTSTGPKECHGKLEKVAGPGDRRYGPAGRRRRPPSSVASDTRSSAEPESEQAFGPGPRARWSRSGPWRSRRSCFAGESDGGSVWSLQRAELVGDGNEPGDPARHERRRGRERRSRSALRVVARQNLSAHSSTQPSGTGDADRPAACAHESSAGSLRGRGKTTAGSLLFKRVVRAVLMVVGNVLSQQSAKVTLVEDDGVIEQFATHASDPALCDTVLPRASEGRPRWAQAEGIHRCEDPVAEYRVSVEDQMAHGEIMRERFAQLLDNPCGSGPVGHVKMENALLSMIDREPYIEDSEGCGRNSKEVHRRDRVPVVAEKLHPPLERTGVWPLARELP